jgi:hypothetical protein
MTLKDKKLLITDLCARLPYGVYIEHTRSGFMGRLHDINVFQTYNKDDTIKDYLCHTNFFGDEACKIEYFKPYLFPLSTMTNQQLKELQSYMLKDSYGILYHTLESYDYLYRNHFDVRGLIEKGLANDATSKNIY